MCGALTSAAPPCYLLTNSVVHQHTICALKFQVHSATAEDGISDDSARAPRGYPERLVEKQRIPRYGRVRIGQSRTAIGRDNISSRDASLAWQYDAVSRVFRRSAVTHTGGLTPERAVLRRHTSHDCISDDS